jgi:hypothetical protein
VEASDADTAIKKAIEDFKITNVQIQKRLVAEIDKKAPGAVAPPPLSKQRRI